MAGLARLLLMLLAVALLSVPPSWRIDPMNRLEGLRGARGLEQGSWRESSVPRKAGIASSITWESTDFRENDGTAAYERLVARFGEPTERSPFCRGPRRWRWETDRYVIEIATGYTGGARWVVNETWSVADDLATRE